jgi:flagellar biosynthetic protein FliP
MSVAHRPSLSTAVALGMILILSTSARADDRSGPENPRPEARPNAPMSVPAPAARAAPSSSLSSSVPFGSRQQLVKTTQAMALFALVSLAPAALLMVTAFVRINIVLMLLRQALGSPQVPGNQVLVAVALLLTALVMKPEAEAVYHHAIEPYAAGRLSAAEAWRAGSEPIKRFMVDQIYRTNHQHYLRELYDYAEPPDPSREEPTDGMQLPLRVVAPAFLLSELTTALIMGFAIYLPFLVIDLVVSAVLVAMGLFMLPPAQVALPLKLIAFVLADGWLLVPTTLLRSFGQG